MTSQLYLVALAMCLASTIAAPVGKVDEQTDVRTDRSAMTEEQQKAYLRRFYGLESIPESFEGAPFVLTDHKRAFQDAVKRLQHMAGLPETGEVDDKTSKVMELPRCGVSDVHAGDAGSRKKRFAAQGSKWIRNDLTYNILNFSPDMTQSAQESEIDRALTVWSENTPLTFRRVLSGQADIEVSFGTFNHGDEFPFDGQGGVLAHAFFPQFGGAAHMDDSETFSAFTFAGINMFQVMAHEFGHSLGLGHSDVQSALMAPFYRGYVPDFQLNQDDINGIQSIYGGDTPSSQTTTETITRPTTGPDICADGQFDAITQFDGITYAFRGSQYVRFNTNGDGIDDGYPADIGYYWWGLPSDLDAVLHVDTQYNYFYENGRWFRNVTVPDTHYFFKGSKVWRVGTDGPVAGYPMPTSSEFPGLPNNIDSAFVWSGNNKIYVTKGNLYYRVTLGSGVDAGYPRSLSAWDGLPSNIDAAFQWSNGKTYFFNGPNYYRFNDEQSTVDSGYPYMTNVGWLGCPGNIVADMTNQENMTPENEEPINGETSNEPEKMDLNLMKPALLNAEDVSLATMDDVQTGGQKVLL